MHSYRRRLMLEKMAEERLIKLLGKYGTTDVYVLRAGVDVVVENNVITGTVSGNVLDLSGQTIVVPEGITKITSAEYECYLKADTMILPQSCTCVEKNSVYGDTQLVLSEGMTNLQCADIVLSGTLDLPSTLTNLHLKSFTGDVYCSEKMHTLVIDGLNISGFNNVCLHCSSNMEELNLGDNVCIEKIYVNNVRMKISCAPESGIKNIYGYAGSTAEAFAKENNLEFINIGSDYSEDIKNLENYGTTDVYVLQEGVDIVVEDNYIRNTVSGEPLILKDKTVVIPDGIIGFNIGDNPIVANSEYLIYCQKCIFPDSLINIVENCVCAKEFVFGKNFESLSLGSGSEEAYPEFVNLNIDDEIYISGFHPRGHVTYGQSVRDVAINAYRCELNITVLNPAANFHIDSVEYLAITIAGYGGSTAEAFAKENNLEFINIGSDYSINIHGSNLAEETIKPNEYYVFTGIPSLTVNLDIVSTTKLDEFMFSFETPADISAFSFGVLTDEAVEIKWIKEPSLKPDYIYEVSVVNGIGVIAGTPKEVE